MKNMQIVSVYFPKSVLACKEEFVIPVIYDSAEYSFLTNTVAHSKYRCCLVINKEGKFNNIVTQGDVLRFSENLSSKDALVADILKTKKPPLVAINSAQSQALIEDNGISTIPLVDTSYNLIGVSYIETNKISHDNITENIRVGLVMSGGKGKRLYPLTKEIPKPLLPIGHQSVLEHVLDSLNHAGIKEYVLMTGHLSEKFIEFKEKSSRNITIFKEDYPLGTGGPLLKWFNEDSSKIDQYINKNKFFTLLVCNGDLIFDIPKKIISEFESSDDKIMLIGRNNKYPVKFGVLSTNDEGYLSGFEEKPVYEFLVNTGIYMFKIDRSFKKIFDHTDITRIDMPDLLTSLEKEHGYKVKVKEILGNYVDVGTKEDLIEISAFFKE